MKRYWRWIVSVIVGLIVFGISLNAAYHAGISASDEFGYRGETIENIAQGKNRIEEYRQEHRKLPLSLEDAYSDLLNRDIKDAYGHLLTYKVTGTHYSIVSYGLDRKPGGTGENTDISSDDRALMNKLTSGAPMSNTTGNLAQTAMIIQQEKTQVDAYFNEYHRMPKTLRDASRDRATEYLQDAFGRSLIYVPDGSTYTILSYGRDGKPGGIGLDADISNKNPYPAQGQMKFEEFLSDRMYQDMISAAVITALAAIALTFFVIHKENWSSRNMGAIVLKTVITLLLTSFVALIITIMHVPSGH